MAMTNGMTDASPRTASHRAPARRRKQTPARRATHRKHGAAQAVGAKLSAMRDVAHSGVELAESKAHEVERTLQDFIRKRPVRTLLIGASLVALAGVGVGLGMRWMRRQ